MHKFGQDNYGWIIVIVVVIILIIIFIFLLAWAFGATFRGGKNYEYCFRSGGTWSGYGVTQNSLRLTQDKAYRVKLDLHIDKIYQASCGNTIMSVRYDWKRLNCDGVVLAQGSDQAFGPLSKDGSVYLTELRESALIKLTPLGDGRVEMIYTEFESTNGKVITIGTLDEVKSCNKKY